MKYEFAVPYTTELNYNWLVANLPGPVQNQRQRGHVGPSIGYCGPTWRIWWELSQPYIYCEFENEETSLLINLVWA